MNDTREIIKNKINAIYDMLTYMKSHGFDCNKYLKEIDVFDKKSANLMKGSNINSNTATQAKDDKETKTLLSAVTFAEKLVAKLYSYFTIYDHAKGLPTKLNDFMGTDQLQSIVNQLLNDLSNYEKIKASDKNFDYEEGIYKILYIVIKQEFRLKGDSDILNFYLKSSLNKEMLDSLIQDDLQKYNVNFVDLIVLPISNEKKEVYDIRCFKNKVLRIAIEENNYKDNMLNLFKELEEPLNRSKKEQSNFYTESVEPALKEKRMRIKEVKKQRLYLTNQILAILVSTAILGGSSVLALKGMHNSRMEETYNTTVSYYDENEGLSSKKLYDDANIGDITYQIYSPTSEDGTRTLSIYSTNDRNVKNAKDAFNYNLENMTLVSEKKILDPSLNQIDNGEYKSVKIVTNIDINDIQLFDQRTFGYYALCVFIETIIFTMWVLLNKVFNENEYEIYTVYGLFEGDICFNDNFGYLKELIDKLEESVSIYNEYNRQNNELLERIKNIKIQYNELYDKYSHLKVVLDQNHIQKKLIKENK